ncbi:MAG: NAD-dependent epimerase/dehydratase family protein, partial [Candidatus Binatia bacterium]
MPAPAGELFAWHERPGALERLTPPWSPVTVLERTGGIRDGGRVVLGIPVGPLTVRWVALHGGYEAGRQFRDEQVSGPFALWRHTHRVEDAGQGASTLEDRIEYALPAGAVGALVGGGATRRLLDRLFTWRHRTTASDLDAHAPCREHPMSVGVTGASGLVGSALVPFLATGGHRVLRLVRGSAGGLDEVTWDPEGGAVPAMDGIDAVVHLAGASIAGGRWTPERKRDIRESRVEGTRALAEALAGLAHPPRVLVCASAIGFYGERGDTEVDESSGPGTRFLADVCQVWE